MTRTDRPTRRTRVARGDVVFWAVALAPVVLVLALPVLALEDSGLHLASASALANLLAGRDVDVLTWRPGIPPNLVVELVVLGLLHVLPPLWVVKVLAAAILVGFALAARRLVAAGGAPAPYAVALLPFAWHRPLAMGFLGFSAAVVLALLCIALVLRRPTRPPLRALAALLVLTWFTHLVPALVATAVCGAVVVLGLVATRSRGVDGTPGATLGRAALAIAPVPVLTVLHVLLNPPGASTAQPGSVVRRIVSVVGLWKATVSMVPAEFVVYGLVSVVLYAAAAAALVVRWRAGWQVRAVDALLLAAVGADLASVLAPEGVSGGGSYLGMRLALFSALLLAGWVAVHLDELAALVGQLAPVAVVAVTAVASLVLVAVRLPAMAHYATLAADPLELAPCLPEYSTVVGVALDGPELAAQTAPLSSEVGTLATLRRSVDLGNESGWVPFYVWRFRDDQNPDRVLATEPSGVVVDPPRIDLAGALRRGERIDAVVTLGRDAGPAAVADAPTRQVLVDLQAGYRRVAVSPAGTAELWLRTGLGSACR